MTAPRAVAYLRIFLALTLALGLGWIATSRHGLDLTGKPLGVDFPSFWAASKLALSGHAAQAYDVRIHYGVQRAAFANAPIGYSAFFYPPIYLVWCLPLAILPYLPSLAVWLGAGLWAYWKTVSAWLGETAEAAPALFAFPAVLSTLGHGQNAFITTALFAAGALLLDRRPFVAGLCLGVLAFKPHLGLVIPVALLAAGRWRTIAGAACAVIAMTAASLLLFGLKTWKAFLAASSLARIALEHDLIGSAKMQSVFAGVRLLHGGLPLAWDLQIIGALVACAIVARVASRRPGARAEGATMISGALLVSPFLLDYDLLLLAVPLSWLFAEGKRQGFLPWEKIVLMAGFVLPLVSRVVAARLGFPLGPPVILMVLLAVARRARPRPVEAPAPA